ncbi:hypothetical protein K439DRAFT_1160085 [Ramaria rubella]|nr:hypothetical protein K439DRAFT_1160085 [Ramaria rubella]
MPAKSQSLVRCMAHQGPKQMAMMVYCATKNLVRAPMLSGHKTASYGGSCVTPSRSFSGTPDLVQVTRPTHSP